MNVLALEPLFTKHLLDLGYVDSIDSVLYGQVERIYPTKLN